MAVEIKIEIDNRNTILEEVENVTVRALMKCGAIVENYAKQDAPVDTGRLRNSIHHEMEKPDTVAIGTDVKYAVYQELGTSRGVKPKRYLTNAVRNHIPQYEAIIRDEFRRG